MGEGGCVVVVAARAKMSHGKHEGDVVIHGAHCQGHSRGGARKGTTVENVAEQDCQT